MVEAAGVEPAANVFKVYFSKFLKIKSFFINIMVEAAGVGPAAC